jgi:4-hydroxythreonine-4-phosphate dehydrogenase
MSARRIGITMGDPAGIGPEIILKALAELAQRDGEGAVSPIVYGTRSVMEAAAGALGLDVAFVDPSPKAAWPTVALVECGEPKQPIVIAATAAEAGRLAFAAIDRAVKDAMAGRIAAIVTAPISKEAVNLAGYAYAGHTDMLADLTQSRDTCMLLAHENLRVAHVSTHVALARVPSLVTPERLTRVLELTLNALHRFGMAKPRIAVAALNPHAGEGGLFGKEDATVIAPTVEAFRRRGEDVSGPIPGDTVFVRALGNEFDAVIAMYHDQGHIPLKLLGFRIDPVARKWTALSGVNVTLGLPFVRTSVDHGTAFDIAGKGIASAQSMVEAIDFALAMTSDKGGAPAAEETRASLGTH